MAITKEQARKVRQPTFTNDIHKTSTLDGTTTTAIVELDSVASEVTVSSPGGLGCTVTFSIDGTNFYGSTAVSSGAVATYGNTGTPNLVKVVKVTRTSGSGILVIAGY